MSGDFKPFSPGDNMIVRHSFAIRALQRTQRPARKKKPGCLRNRADTSDPKIRTHSQ
jgi:hypothetical protein